MGKALGSPKTGGRKKGALNKKTLSLAHALECHQFDIAGHLKEILPQVSPEKQADILLNLMNYIYPKRKPVDSLPNVEPQNNTETIEIIFVEPDRDFDKK